MTPGPLLLAAAACLVTGMVVGPRSPRAWLTLQATGVLAAFGAALFVLLGYGDWEWRSAVALGGETVHLRLDGLSALFLAPVCVAGGGAALYARQYWSDQHYPMSAPRGRAWWSALVLSMGLVLTISNGLHFLIAWESFAVCAYFLITLDRQRRETRAAGWVYLLASHAGTLALFAFFTALAERTGSWDLEPVRDVALAPLFWLALFGFGMKAGFFPLHFWLPAAHANAPSHVSAIMSGVAIKMGLYGIVRFSGWMPTPAAAGWIVIAIGGTSALIGIAFAFAQDDVKRLLAYCSVENVGVILIGLGGAMLAASHGGARWGVLALAGALFHVWNHGAFKVLLFLGAGSVVHGTGTREMSRLGGLWRTMPWTAAMFAVGAVAVSGLPPLNGFVSEWLIYLGLLDAVAGKGPTGWAAIPAIIALAMAGALALASFVKAGAMIFLGSSRTQPAAAARESGRWMLLPMLALAACCFTLALAPVLFWPAVARAVGAWHPAWASAAVPAPLSSLGMAQAALLLLGVAAAAVMFRKVQANGRRHGLTWDCGYAVPTTRMQYSSGSFASIAGGWFGWILRPRRFAKRPRGLLPIAALRLQRVPEAVLELVIAPAGDMIGLASRAARRLQHGSLQAYILYVVAALTLLGILVSTAGPP